MSSSHLSTFNLIKKMTQVAARNRVIVSEFMKTDNFTLATDAAGYENLSHPQDDLIPLQLWDELFESALVAIGDGSNETFDET